jgi:hypothetical protein
MFPMYSKYTAKYKTELRVKEKPNGDVYVEKSVICTNPIAVAIRVIDEKSDIELQTFKASLNRC